MERLALIEVLDHDGHVLHAVPVVHWPMTVGRALDCDVVLDDPHVAARHLTLDAAGGAAPGLVLTVGESVNGVQMDRRQLSSGASALLQQGSALHVGRSVLRVRLAGESLAPERPLARSAHRIRLTLTVGAAVAVLLWASVLLWLDNVPGSSWDKYLPTLLGVMFGIAAWASLWGLGSKLFQRHFRALPHLRILLGFVLAILLVDTLLALASFALGVPWLSHIRSWVRLAMVAALLGTHLWLLLPGRQRAIALTVGALLVLVLGVEGALSWRHRQRLFDELYVATLPPPGLRLVRAEPVAALLDDLRPLRASLERRAKKDEETDAPAER
jgi:hypothetical protein